MYLEAEMDIFNIVAVGVTIAVLAVLLRQYKQEYAVLLTLCGGILILILIITKALPVFKELDTLMKQGNISTQYAVILLKALGICFITQLGSDACQDANETAIASKIELAGKFAVLIVALPLFSQVASLATNLLK
jgi:stage III sporulation protein AD